MGLRPQSQALSAAKADLRASMKAHRDSLDPAARAQASCRVVRALREVPLYRAAASCLAYIPFGSEVDIAPLLEEPGEGKAVYVTRCALATRSMEVCAYPCPLERTRFGLAQPSAVVPALDDRLVSSRLGVALVPGLAFSRATRHRLGYGAGFYDIFLSQHRVPTIGICFHSQLLDELPHDELDTPVDLLVTDQGVVGP